MNRLKKKERKKRTSDQGNIENGTKLFARYGQIKKEDKK